MEHFKYGKTQDIKSGINTLKKSILALSEDRVDFNSINIPMSGTVKVHGTNFSIVLTKNNELYYQTRKQTIVDGMDFYNFRSLFNADMINESFLRNQLEPLLENGESIALYGELFGKGVQSKVGVSSLPLTFMAFSLARIHKKEFQEDVYETVNGVRQIKHHKGENYFEKEHLDLNLIQSAPELRFYKATDFKTYQLNLNLNNTKDFAEQVQKLTEEVEKVCPVATALADDLENTIGEGIVWAGQVEFENRIYRLKFKTKGDKHKRSSKKNQSQSLRKDISPEEKAAWLAFEEQAINGDRLEQGLEIFQQQNLDFDLKNIRHYIEWVREDVKSECAELIEALMQFDNTEKQIISVVNKAASKFFLDQFHNNI